MMENNTLGNRQTNDTAINLNINNLKSVQESIIESEPGIFKIVNSDEDDYNLFFKRWTGYAVINSLTYDNVNFIKNADNRTLFIESDQCTIDISNVSILKYSEYVSEFIEFIRSNNGLIYSLEDVCNRFTLSNGLSFTGLTYTDIVYQDDRDNVASSVFELVKYDPDKHDDFEHTDFVNYNTDRWFSFIDLNIFNRLTIENDMYMFNINNTYTIKTDSKIDILNIMSCVDSPSNYIHCVPKKEIVVHVNFKDTYDELFKNNRINEFYNFKFDFAVYENENIIFQKGSPINIHIDLYKNVTYQFNVFGDDLRYNLRCIKGNIDHFRNCLISYTNKNTLFKVRESGKYVLKIVPYNSTKTNSITIKNMKLVNDISEKVYVLNLKNKIQDYYLLENILNRFYINCERFDAIDGKDSAYDELWQSIQSKPMTEGEIKIGRRYIMSRGALGYLLSMKALFEEAKRENYRYLTVLDDDVMLLKKDFIKNQAEQLCLLSDFKIFKYGSSQWTFDNIDICSNYYRCNDMSNGSFFVIYRHDTYDSILAKIDEYFKPFDSGCLPQFTSHYYCSYPNLAIANLDHISSIFNRSREKEYSRFRWNRSEYIGKQNKVYSTIYRTKKEFIKKRLTFVIGITTVNRPYFFKDCVRSIIESMDDSVNYVLLVSNGSKNMYEQYQQIYDHICNEEMMRDNLKVNIFQNNLQYINYQSNLILKTASEIDFDYGFIINDDVKTEKGWDKTYYERSIKYNCQHMCTNLNTKDTEVVNEDMKTNGSVLKSNGIMLTFTKDIINKVGYFNEIDFKVRGHSHVDYSMRCCKAGFNSIERFLDIKESNELIKLLEADLYNYANAIERSDTYERYLHFVDVAEKDRRDAIINDMSRIYSDTIFNC